MALKLQAAYEKAVAEGRGDAFLKSHPKFAANLQSQAPAPTSEPAPDPTTTKDVIQGTKDVGGAALDLAADRLATGGYDEAFDPTLTDRPMSGDLAADRARIENDVFNRLTGDFELRRGQEQEALAQRLSEQGIQFDDNPNSRYAREMKAFNDRWENAYGDARLQATQIGGQEYERGFTIGETLRRNELAEQQGIRNQNLGEIGGFISAGTDVAGLLSDIRDERKRRQLEEYIANLQAQTSQANANTAANAAITTAGIAANASQGNPEDDVFVGGGL